jgi:hypothetical protein
MDLIRRDLGDTWNGRRSEQQGSRDVPITELNMCISHVG